MYKVYRVYGKVYRVYNKVYARVYGRVYRVYGRVYGTLYIVYCARCTMHSVYCTAMERVR